MNWWRQRQQANVEVEEGRSCPRVQDRVLCLAFCFSRTTKGAARETWSEQKRASTNERSEARLAEKREAFSMFLVVNERQRDCPFFVLFIFPFFIIIIIIIKKRGKKRPRR